VDPGDAEHRSDLRRLEDCDDRVADPSCHRNLAASAVTPRVMAQGL
jgi:hypothetical protein